MTRKETLEEGIYDYLEGAYQLNMREDGVFEILLKELYLAGSDECIVNMRKRLPWTGTEEDIEGL